MVYVPIVIEPFLIFEQIASNRLAAAFEMKEKQQDG